MNFLAAKNGSYEICKLLIHTIKYLRFHQEYLCFILHKNINQRTAIHEAARMGNLNILNLFFRMINYEHRIGICEDSDDELKTSLHLAAAEGKTISLPRKKQSNPIPLLKRSFRNRSISSQSRCKCFLI
jgi:ankyrin repeat protein